MDLKSIIQDKLRKVSFARQFFDCRNLTSVGTNGIKAKFISGGQENFDYDHDSGKGTFTVYQFSYASETVYVRFSGIYTSYNGLEYEEYEFVKPVEVTRIEYVKE